MFRLTLLQLLLLHCRHMDIAIDAPVLPLFDNALLSLAPYSVQLALGSSMGQSPALHMGV